MNSTSVRLDAGVRIPVLEPLRAVNQALLELIRGFTREDWHRPTIHRDRDVKDLAAHLLHGSLRRVSAMRDGYMPPPPPINSFEDLVAFIQDDNREFMLGMRRLSPGVLIELLEIYDRELMALFEAADPSAPALGVAWAGERTSQSWFDIAREYTEKWHHQQQLRDATGRPPLYERALLEPVLETFARGLPFAYRDQDARDGTCVAVEITGPVSLGWTLRRSGGAWALWSGSEPAAEAVIALDADVAWRIWTKGLDADQVRARVLVTGDGALAEPLLGFVAIMA